MPTYDYVCNECDHEFEVFQSMTAPVKRKCPKCKRMSLQRLIGTGAGVIFKGSGFYETDYRSESYKKAADADKGAKDDKSSSSSSTSTDGAGKSETNSNADAKPKADKPAKKTETKSKKD